MTGFCSTCYETGGCDCSTNPFKKALNEMQPVREMTVDEITKMCWDLPAEMVAKKLAKLGTIRIVGDAH